MAEVIRFAILGLAAGGIYALLALGIVVVHRSSGAVNFASGAMAVAAGYLLLQLEHLGLPTAAAVVLAVLGGLLFGLIVQVLVMRPLRAASALTKAIATLGILVILQSGCQLKFGTVSYVVPAFLPVRHLDILGARVTSDYVIIFVLTLVLTAALVLGYRRTRLGLATSAVAENEEALETLGWSATFVARLNWALAGALTALAGVLIAPITGLELSFMTSLLIASLAAALFGGLTSFPLTLVGALGIGVIQSELTYYADKPVLRSLPGLGDAVPFLLIIVILIIRGKSLPSRGFIGLGLPRLGSGAASWWAVAPLLIVSIVLIQVLLPVQWVLAVTTCLIAGCILLSLVVVIGYAGQLSLMQASIGGLCALIAARLVADSGWPLPIACIVGVAVAVPVGIIVGLPAARTRGVTLAVVTLGLAESLNALVFTTQKLSGGDSGINVGAARVFGVAIDEADFPRRYSLVALAIFVLLALAVLNLRRSAVGRKLIAVRSNERAAASLGLSVTRIKLYAFVLSAALAAVGGMLIAFRYGDALFDNFDPFQSVNYVVEAVVGGVGFLSGAVAGTGLEPGGVANKVMTGIGLGDWLIFVGGFLLLVTVILNPDGIAGGISLQVAWLRRRLGLKPRSAVSIQGLASGGQLTRKRQRPNPLCLSVEDVTVQFGGVKAVDGVSFDLRSGEILGVIGPNGAGKTTLIDAVSGYVPCSGRIIVDGTPIHGMAVHERSRIGITRSFQSLELFEDLTVAENLLVASEHRGLGYWLSCLVWPGRPRLGDAASAAVEEFDLGAEIQLLPSQLSYAQRRLLAISRAVASQPRVLMLDEPAAGLDDRDRDELKRLLTTLAGGWGMAVLLVEHDVDLVMSVSHRIIAIDFGRVVATGSPDEIRKHPDVIRSYLGTDEEEPVSRVPGLDSLVVDASSAPDATR